MKCGIPRNAIWPSGEREKITLTVCQKLFGLPYVINLRKMCFSLLSYEYLQKATDNLVNKCTSSPVATSLTDTTPLSDVLQKIFPEVPYSSATV